MPTIRFSNSVSFQVSAMSKSPSVISAPNCFDVEDSFSSSGLPPEQEVVNAEYGEKRSVTVDRPQLTGFSSCVSDGAMNASPVVARSVSQSAVAHVMPIFGSVDCWSVLKLS